MASTPNLSKHVEGKTILFWSILCGTLTLTVSLSASAAENWMVFKNTSTVKVHLSNPSEQHASFQDKPVFISRASQNDKRNNNLIEESPVPHEYQVNLVGSPGQLLGESIKQELKGNQDTLSKEDAEIDKAFYGLEGNVYYVSDAGNDSNNGREENFPFKTLQHASNRAEPGDIVYVMSGLYQNEQDEDILGIKQSGTESNWIMYAALPGHKPKLKVKAGDAISIHGAEYIIIDGFEIEGNNPNVSLDYALAEKNSLANKITNSSGVSIHPDWNTALLIKYSF